MKKKSLKIHSKNILPIIKQWLYSDKDIFVRELVANACDACSKHKMITGETGHTIDITIDKEAKTLTFTDTGIGMSAGEVEKYIAQIAFSGAEEFVDKYQQSGGADGVIGHFGLGFYSAYMVASSVTIDTLSYEANAEAALWTCDGSVSYTLGQGLRAMRGTQITLHINEESLEYLEKEKIRTILKKHCAFLPFALTLNGERINDQEPLWLKPASECTDEEYLEFYRALYPAESDPLFWIHLSVDFPFHLQGILYFPKIRRHFDTSKNTIQLFCNRVFVTDNCKDLIPEFLTVLQGAIDSPDIPLNVSRSQLQMNATVRQLSTHISKKVSDKLKELHDSDFQAFCSKWPDIEVILKMGALQDSKFFERIAPLAIWKNLEGTWRHLADYLESHEKEYDGRVFYTQDEKNTPACLELYRKKEIEVLYTHPFIDSHFLPHLERRLKEKHPMLSFKRIDAEMPDLLLDGESADASELIAIVKTHLNKEGLEVEAKHLASNDLFGFVTFDESSRRMRDQMQMYSEEGGFSMPMKQTFVLNSASPLAQALPNLHKNDPDLAKELTEELYELSLLSQREIAPEALSGFLNRTQRVLAALVSRP